MSTSTLVVIGSGPGIGLLTATLFAAKKFNTVVLISRNNIRIQQDQKSLFNALPSTRSVEVKTFNVDITNTKAFEKVLEDVKSIGNISCVLFNAARVAPSELLGFPEEELLRDFQVSLSIDVSLSKLS
jgi:short-subunit dehydrogenase